MSAPTRPTAKIPRLEPGDRLTRDEFERRYQAMPHVTKAELIEGEVHMPSPVNWVDHAVPHSDLNWLMKHYSVFTPGVSVGDNATVLLDTDNEPQPDVTMIIHPDAGGAVELDTNNYIAGAPELVAEVSASSASIDLGRKLDVYRRNRVSEYVVWRVLDEAVDWFRFDAGQFAPLLPDPADGLLKSGVFPGLWLDPAALVRRDLAAVLAALSRGLASPEHAAFAATLAGR